MGVIYLVLLNPPNKIRYKQEYAIKIPGPSEPSPHINTILSPLVTNLKDLWEGVPLCLHSSQETVKVRSILLRFHVTYVHGRFLSYNADKGCTR